MAEYIPRWYVLQTMSGKENKVEKMLRAKFRLPEYAGIEDYIQEIKIPIERVSEIKEGKRREIQRKIFPGYILMKVALFSEDNVLNERVWYYIREVDGVIGFAGGEQPVALSDAEVVEILAQTEKGEIARPKVTFEIGEKVIIREGAFANHEAVVEAVNIDTGKLKIAANIFGRSTPVEVEFWQVERSV